MFGKKKGKKGKKGETPEVEAEEPAKSEAAAEGADGEGEGEAKPKKKLPLKLIIIGAVALLLVGGGGGGAAWFFLLKPKPTQVAEGEAGAPAPKGKEKPKKEKESGHGGEGGEGAAADGEAGQIREGPDGVVFYTLPDLITNIQTTDGRPNLLKLKVTFELGAEEDADVLNEEMPRLQDILQTFLRELRPDDLTGSQGGYRLKQEIQRRVNLVIAPSKVNAVLIEEMLQT